jgi:hypothetical protein
LGFQLLTSGSTSAFGPTVFDNLAADAASPKICPAVLLTGALFFMD